MKALQSVLDAAQFVFDGFFEIFSDTDNYPSVGFQPYEGDAYAK
ncbi:MAG: isochorismate synthase [Synechococcales cyanobacterium RM1_1_8]|nr:isochorismate synthase [Synechococcales cyanobacterium RM1_1_8]